MRKSIIFAGLGLLVINVFAFFILESYSLFNCILSSAIIFYNLILGELVYTHVAKDAFKISIGFIFSVIGFLKFIIALFTPDEFSNNVPILIIVALIIFQLSIFFLVTRFKSN